MNLTDWIQLDKLVTFLLILFRVAGVFLVAPLLGNRAVPMQVQLAISVTLAILLFPLLNFQQPQALTSDLYLAQLIFQEVTIGVIIGFVAAVMFAAISVAGEIFGMKVGFAIAQIIDPANEGSSGLLTSLYTLLGGMIFLYLDGHHVIIQALVDSFKLIPLGDGINLSIGTTINEFMVRIFAIGIKIAAPVMVVMTLLYIAFGLITKLSPQLNIYFNVGFILGPVIGLVTLAVSLPLFRYLMTSLTNELGSDLVITLRALKGI